MAKLHGAGDGHRRVRHRRDSFVSLEDEKLHKSCGEEPLTPDPDELRRLRIEKHDQSASATTEKSAAAPKMATESPATVPSSRRLSSHRRRREHRRDPDETRQHRRKESATNDEAAATDVYGALAERKVPQVVLMERRVLGRDGDSSESSESEEDPVRRSRVAREKPKERKIKVVYVSAKSDTKPVKHKERRIRESSDQSRSPEPSPHSSTHHSRHKSAPEVPASPPQRSTPTRQLHSEVRPLRRSNTTASHVPSSKAQAPSISPTKTRRSSIFGSLFAVVPQQPPEPEKLVECLTCLSDDIPRSKAAKLKCGHRMCHSCLRRIFKLSTTDPQHMPPKCCTADHIPLRHVEKLFDNNFKRTWNRKFQEFSTKNRIYCPARRCGEWIRPEDMHKENGKKYGKCGRCKSKVCCLCNGKWHGSKDCPKDEETNQLLETAKQAGWKRCYNCRTMVELKEGCNHMTCRCTAEFCMVCGLKWKTCNCPWFNYEAVEADRLQHLQIPMEVPHEGFPEERPRRLRRPRPNTYNEELDERQRQERMDEEIARRLQRVAVIDDDGDYQGGVGDIHGIGNGAAHFMNQDYIRAAHNIITGNYDHAAAAANYVMGVNNLRGAPLPPDPGPRRMVERYPIPGRPARLPSPPPPPPLLRRHSIREQTYDMQTRPAERGAPRRTRIDNNLEANTPVGRTPVRAKSSREPRTSVLAGLGARGNRVSAWRSHVEPGVTPEEGLLSI